MCERQPAAPFYPLHGGEKSRLAIRWRLSGRNALLLVGNTAPPLSRRSLNGTSPRHETELTRGITGTMRSQMDRIPTSYWSGGSSNSLGVIEPNMCDMLMGLVDELRALEEKIRLGNQRT